MTLPITSTTREFISLREVLGATNITTLRDDQVSELAMIHGTAMEAVETLVGPILHRPVTEVVRAVDGIVVLEHAPVVSVQSLTAASQPISYAQLKPGAGMLLGVRATYGDLTVTYTAGRTTLPYPIKMGALSIARHLWRKQLGAGAPARGALPQSDDEDTVTPATLGYAIPREALEHLAPYLLEPGIG